VLTGGQEDTAFYFRFLIFFLIAVFKSPRGASAEQNQSNAQGVCKKFEYFRIFSIVSHHFSNIFEYFQTFRAIFRMFSNVFERFYFACLA